MPKLGYYHVQPDNNGEGWAVRRGNAERDTKEFDTKQEAIEAAKEYALNNDVAQVLIHNSEGEIHRDWTHPDHRNRLGNS